MKSAFLNQKGIALLIVMSALMVLTTAVVEFAYDSRINYELAVTNKEKLQATYLARSALNFSKLLLKYQKEADKLLKQAGDQAKGVMPQPLYKMMPLSSELLRGLAESTGDSGEGTSEGEGDKQEASKDAPKEEGGGMESQIKASAGILAGEEAQKFLSFDGDFSSEISEEMTKFDLNKIYGVETTSVKNYDSRKKLLLAILKMPPFKDLFQSPQDAEKLVHALSDWVDSNDVINEFDNVQRGTEDSIYRDNKIKVKNGKFVTLSELRLVEGMNDQIFEALKPYVTISSNSDKINFCLADEEMQKALVYHYIKNSQCGASPLDPEDEKLNEYVEEAVGGCPEPSAVAAALNTKLGLSTTIPDPDAAGGGAAPAQPATPTGCLFQFSDLITSDNNVFTIRARGQVGDTVVTLVQTLGVQSSNPDQWKEYGFQIE